ncbi:hypothetical protein [Streptomyces goshikiensis]|uniref:hypothetical protein n=1 Tax=Streptomyces goshikiensis TaxID=1942 RepID=UPI0036972C97
MAVLAVLQLAVLSPSSGLIVCALGAVAGLVLWLRTNRTVAAAVLSTSVTMMWVPEVIDSIGQAAGVPAAIASWDVVPLWALTLAATAGAWLPTRTRGSRAVTALLCHLAVAVAALPAAVFPASSVSGATATIVAVLVARSHVPAAVRMRWRARAARGTQLRTLRDAGGRLWLTAQAAPDETAYYTGEGGQLAVVHQLRPGQITLGRVINPDGTAQDAYALNGSVEDLAEDLAEFAAADRQLAQRLNLDPAQVTTLVTAPRARLPKDSIRLDLAGIWDQAAHRYADHPVTLRARADATEYLHELQLAAAPRRRGRKARDGHPQDQDQGDVRQRRVAAAAAAWC